ncbi:MAG: hypothetical protein V4735_00805 [Pseudomonadota bacterium]
MAFNYVNPESFDNSPLFQALKAGVKALPKGILDGLAGVVEMTSEAAGGVVTGAGRAYDGVKTTVGALHSIPAAEPEKAQVRAPEIGLAGPTSRNDRHSCTLDDVVCQATPVVNRDGPSAAVALR